MSGGSVAEHSLHHQQVGEFARSDEALLAVHKSIGVERGAQLSWANSAAALGHAHGGERAGGEGVGDGGGGGGRFGRGSRQEFAHSEVIGGEERLTDSGGGEPGLERFGDDAGGDALSAGASCQAPPVGVGQSRTDVGCATNGI